jgi:hypothetical protein
MDRQQIVLNTSIATTQYIASSCAVGVHSHHPHRLRQYYSSDARMQKVLDNHIDRHHLLVRVFSDDACFPFRWFTSVMIVVVVVCRLARIRRYASIINDISRDADTTVQTMRISTDKPMTQQKHHRSQRQHGQRHLLHSSLFNKNNNIDNLLDNDAAQPPPPLERARCR